MRIESVCLDSEFVEAFSQLYDSSEESERERDLFLRVSLRVQEGCFYSWENFLLVCGWKTARTKSLVRSNSPEQVVEVTRIALTCSEALRIPVLCLLKGVSIPTASALLTLWRPDHYTVVDFRVLDALSILVHSELNETSVARARRSYQDYLSLVQVIIEDIGCDLRSLDKALWMFDKARTAK